MVTSGYCQRRKLSAVDHLTAVLAPSDRQTSALAPAAHGVVTDPEQGRGLAHPELAHRVTPLAFTRIRVLIRSIYPHLLVGGNPLP